MGLFCRAKARAALMHMGLAAASPVTEAGWYSFYPVHRRVSLAATAAHAGSPRAL